MHLASPLIHAILACFLKNGLSPATILAKAGFTEHDLASAQAEVAARSMALLWEGGIDEGKNPYLPLLIGSQLYVEQLGLLGYILQNSERLGEAIIGLEKYSLLTNNFVSLGHQQIGNTLELRFWFNTRIPTIPSLKRAFTLLEFGFFAGGIAQLLGSPVPPQYIKADLEPEDRAHLSQILGCDVQQGDDQNVLAIPASYLASPILMPDPATRRQFETLADLELSKLGMVVSWSDKVRQLLVAGLQSNRITIAEIADALAMSPRVLQRRLKDEGTTFRVLFEDVKLEVAKHYLALGLPVAEIATLLGYQDPSAFSRAFRGWTGVAPLQWREEVVLSRYLVPRRCFLIKSLRLFQIAELTYSLILSLVAVMNFGWNFLLDLFECSPVCISFILVQIQPHHSRYGKIT